MKATLNRIVPPTWSSPWRSPPAENVMMGRLAVWMLCLIGLFGTAGCGDDGPMSAANRPPLIQAQQDTMVAVGDTLYLKAEGDDPDGDRVTFGLTVYLSAFEIKSGYRPNTTFDGETGDFWFRPTLDDRPTRDFGFTASDGQGGVDSTRFVVSVD